MGGIQSVSTLPSDPTFNSSNNNFDVASYKRICAEFGIDPASDFRFTGTKKSQSSERVIADMELRAVLMVV